MVGEASPTSPRSCSPNALPSSSIGADQPIVAARFPAASTSCVEPAQFCPRLDEPRYLRGIATHLIGAGPMPFC